MTDDPSGPANSGRAAIVELLLTVAAPTIVLTWFSDDATLGAAWGLVVALCFPLGHAAYTIVRQGRISAIAALVVVSVLLTGGIGLWELDVRWFAWKEAALPVALGLATLVSAFTRWPALPVLLDPLLNGPRIDAAIAERDAEQAHRADLARATAWMGVVFLVTAAGTFAFARFMVTAPTGSDAFIAELGRYTGWSFPAMGIPSMGGAMLVLRGVLTRLEDRTGLPLEDLLR